MPIDLTTLDTHMLLLFIAVKWMVTGVFSAVVLYAVVRLTNNGGEGWEDKP